MARTYTINVGASAEALAQLATTDPRCIRIEKLAAFLGAPIRNLHDRGHEEDDIAATLHAVNPDVPLPYLLKEIRKICVPEPLPQHHVTALQASEGGEPAGTTPPRRGRGRPRLSQTAGEAASPQVVNVDLLRNDADVTNLPSSSAGSLDILDEGSSVAGQDTLSAAKPERPNDLFDERVDQP